MGIGASDNKQYRDRKGAGARSLALAVLFVVPTLRAQNAKVRLLPAQPKLMLMTGVASERIWLTLR